MLALASMAWVPVSGVAADITGNVFGAVNSYAGMASTEQGYAGCYWGRIDFAGSSVVPIYKGIEYCNALDQEHQTGAVREGILYIPQGNRSSVRDVDVEWKRIDITTGRVLPSIDCKDDVSLWMQSMCYDPVTDSFYGMTINDSSTQLTANRIVKVTINKNNMPEVTVLADYPPSAGSYYYGFFYHSGEKAVYALCDNGSLYTLDRNTGKMIKAADISAESYEDEQIALAGYDARGTMQVVYSPKDDSVILVGRDSSVSPQQVYLYILNPYDGDMRRLCTLNDAAYPTALYCPDPYAEPDAAGETEITSFNLQGASLSGSVSYKIPSSLYNGMVLKQDVTLRIFIDGVEKHSAKVAPGTTGKYNFAVTEGEHRIALRCDITDNLPGPETVQKFYAGNDTPLSPEGLVLSGNTLTWNACGALGVNGGYVDTAALRYDVYFGSVKQNSQPLATTSYTFPDPAEMALTQITVAASANGKTSAPSAVLDAVIGKSLTLDWSAGPTIEEAALFTALDANRDGSSFAYDTESNSIVHMYENYQGSDDWLILPKLWFDKADRMYQLLFSFANATPYYGSETFDICIGKLPEASAMDKVLCTYTKIALGDDSKSLPVDVRFSVPEAGEYYLGIHMRTGAEGSGSRLCDFAVNRLEETTGVPAKPSDVRLEAAPAGELNGVIKLTVPAKAANGSALAADENLTVEVRNLDGDKTHVASAEARPGESVSLKCAGLNGFNSYEVWVEGSAGRSPAAVVRAYIGVDVPQVVTGFHHEVADDNLTMTLYWDKVTEGINGGFIDPENMGYQVWYNSSGVTWNRVGQKTKDTSAVFDPQNAGLARWRLTVMAENSAGFKKAYSVNSIEEVLGAPNTLPIIEPFATQGPAYPWNYVRNTPQTENSSISQKLNDELGLMNIGSPRFEDGSGRVVSSLIYGAPTDAEIIVPKFTTNGMSNPLFVMRYWNYDNAAPFDLYGRRNDRQEAELLKSFKPSDAPLNEWHDFTFELPDEYKDKNWVEFRLRFHVPGVDNGYGVIDNINIYENVDHDFKLVAVDGGKSTIPGDSEEFSITVLNSGLERSSGTVKVEIVGDGNVLETQSYNVTNIRSFHTHTRTVTLDSKTEYLSYGKIEVRATVESPDDKIAANNTASTEWIIGRPSLPVVSNLYGTRRDEDHNAVELRWSKPNMSYGDFETMEYLEPFDYSERLGEWINYDADGYQNYDIGGLGAAGMWKDAGVPKAWQVINDKALGVDNDPRLSAHSGNQYLMAISGWDPKQEGASVQVSDWLISPEVKGGTEVRFWMNTVNASYQETIHVMYSTTDNDPKSFTKLCNRSKVGEASWEQTSFTLPANAKYFALVYVGWDSYGVLVDDIEFTPVQLSKYELKAFDVYRLGQNDTEPVKLAETTETTYTDKSNGDVPADYYVITRVMRNGREDAGAKSNVVSVSDWSGVDEIAVADGVYGLDGAILFEGHEGETAAIYNAEGMLLDIARIGSASERIHSESGIRLVKIGNRYAKVLVK